LSLSIPLRKLYGLEDFITTRHLDNMGKVMLANGLIVAYGYMMETFMSWYSVDVYDKFTFHNRFFGPYAPAYWALLTCNIFLPQFLWSRRVRRNALSLFAIAMVINLGMWLERFEIVITSLHRDFLPSSWGMYYPTRWDWATLIGTIGLFLALLFIFIRFLPLISIFEMRGLVATEDEKSQESNAGRKLPLQGGLTQ
jgi:Ni/Fe-hydrogenase subunit HybB-like protein